MPNWLNHTLRWGGLAVAIVSAVALIYVLALAPTPEAGSPVAETTAAVPLYWVLLVVGIGAAFVGFAAGRSNPTAGT